MTEAYDVPLTASANCVVIAGRRDGEERVAACVVRADTRADVNNLAKRTLDVRKASFLSMDRAVEESGMEYGGITPRRPARGLAAAGRRRLPRHRRRAPRQRRPPLQAAAPRPPPRRPPPRRDRPPPGPLTRRLWLPDGPLTRRCRLQQLGRSSLERLVSRPRATTSAGSARGEGALGGGDGEGAVGGHQADPGAPVEQVDDVEGALVADAPEQLGQRGRRYPRPRGRAARRRRGRARGRARGGPAPRCRTSGPVAPAPSTRASTSREAAPISGRSLVRHGPAGSGVRASTASTASSRHPPVGRQLAADDGHDAVGRGEHGVPAGQVGGRRPSGPRRAAAGARRTPRRRRRG